MNYKNFLKNSIKVILTTLSISILSVNAIAVEKLKIAHVYEVDHPVHLAAVAAAEKVATATEGRIELNIFPASSLGQESALNEALSLGTIDIIFTGAGFASTSYGPIGLSNYPFTLRDTDHWKKYRESDLFQEIIQGYKDTTGNTIVDTLYYGSRHVTSNKEIKTPDDMIGLKIRVPNAPPYIMFPEAVGANATPMAFAEVYLALQQGVVDAQENPLTTIRAKKFYEVQSNISLTAHIIDSLMAVISQYTLDKLSEEDTKIVMEALSEACAVATNEIIEQEKVLTEWFIEQGINVNEVEREAFMEKVKPMLIGDDLPFTAEQFERLQAL